MQRFSGTNNIFLILTLKSLLPLLLPSAAPNALVHLWGFFLHIPLFQSLASSWGGFCILVISTEILIYIRSENILLRYHEEIRALSCQFLFWWRHIDALVRVAPHPRPSGGRAPLTAPGLAFASPTTGPRHGSFNQNLQHKDFKLYDW